MGSLTVHRIEGASVRELAARSVAWDQAEGDATLVVAVPKDAATLIGSFQRSSDAPPGPLFRRGSGGAAVHVGPGSVWVQLALAQPGVLVACTADKLINRYVRPVLRSLTRVAGTPAAYFGRDWVAVRHRPAGLVAFAHDASSGRSFVEAIVGVSESFSLGDRVSFAGKAPLTLDEAAERAIDPVAVADAIVDAYRGLASESRVLDAPPVGAPSAADVADAPPWAATLEVAIGNLGAGPDASGRLRVGGELMASRDAVVRLEDGLAALPASADADALDRLVDDSLGMQGAIVFGVRSLTSVRDVIVAARA